MSRKYSIEDMKKLAVKRGGECLSKEYINSKTKLKWKCQKGHIWYALRDNVDRGSWCPFCAGLIKGSINEMKEIADSRGGECLSNEYVNIGTKLRWRCSEGHEWEATPRSVKHLETWCPFCAGNVKHTINDMKEIAESKGGECLSEDYINSHNTLQWKCSEGHEWETPPTNIQSGNWCPFCAGIIKLTIKEMKEIAESRGGKCLSKEYVNDRTKLRWCCSEGHEWEATPDNVKRGKWCPYCPGGISEKICRRAFELIFSNKFPNCRPKWLINPNTKSRMELDGFCKEIGIAFEYQGKQHYEEIENFFHKNKKYIKQKQRDELKRKLCKQNNIILIEVPYHIKYSDIPTFIISQCNKINIELPEINLDVFDYKQYDGIYNPKNLERMKMIAKERGGECLSDKYINIHTNLKWRCRNGHEWEARPSNVINGTWCPKCAIISRSNKRKLGLEEMQNIARSRDGQCISKEYINANTKLKWRCKEGHEWEATPNNVKRGTWCPICSQKRSKKRKSNTIFDYD